MKPAMHDSSVVLPQPDAPSATTKSPGSSARLTSESASVVAAGGAGVVDADVADVELAQWKSRDGCGDRASPSWSVVPAEAGTQRRENLRHGSPPCAGMTVTACGRDGHFIASFTYDAFTTVE